MNVARPAVIPVRLTLLCSALLVLPSTAFAQRTSVARDFPLYLNDGKADLAVDSQRFVAQMETVDRYFAPDDCALADGVVGDSGYRRLHLFDTVVMKRGGGDLVGGTGATPTTRLPRALPHP